MKSRNSFSPLRMLMVALLAVGLAVNNAGFVTFAPQTADAAIIQTNRANLASLDASIDEYSQCANDAGTGYTTGDTGCRWTNGDLNHQNSTIFEGDSTVQRLLIDKVTNGPHTVKIEYQTTKQGKHAYDYLTDDLFSETWVTAADICDSPVSTSFPACEGLTPNLSPVIPADPNANGHDATDRHFKIRNGTITTVGTPTIASGTYAGDSLTDILVTFSVNTSTCADKAVVQGTDTCPVLITWGAHVSRQLDWGSGNSAVNIEGSPYHVKVVELDGSSIGNRDNQMAAKAVLVSTLTLVKTVTNTNGGTAVAGDWTLTATGPQTISGVTGTAQVTGAEIAPGTYTLSESGPSGYTTTGWSCVKNGGNPAIGSTITLANLDVATCTINNHDSAAGLHLRKTVTNDNGGTALATAWTLSATGTGGSPTNLSGATPVDSGIGFKADTYALAESGGPAGYTAGAWDCGAATMPDATHVTVPLGGNVTCTINNNDNAPALHLRKVVVNDNGGTALATAWTLTATGTGGSPTNLSGATPVDSGTGFKADTYTLAETGPAGYTASSWVCVGGTQAGNTIAIGLGQSATCTITNVQQSAHLTLVKGVTNDNGGTAVPSDFTLSATGPTPISGAGGANSVVSPGTYSLSETGPSGYTSSGWTCVKNNEQSSTGTSITLANGDNATCTITNDDVAPSLTLVKNVINDNGGTAAASAWTLTATGPTTISGAGGAASGAGFQAGTYALAESAGPAGYSATAWSCVKNGGAAVTGSSITLANGDTATCTITNNDNPPTTPEFGTLVVLKYNDLNGNGARDTGEPVLGNVTFTLSTNGVQLGTLVTDANGNATRTGLGAGSYTIVETIPTGWFSTDPGTTTPTKTAAVSAGQTTTVMFGNKQVTIPPTTIGGAIVVTKYEDSNRNKQRDANEGVLSGWTFAVRDGQGALVATITTTANGTASAANLPPGTYTVSETVQTGWVSTDPGGSLPSKTVTIAAGQTVNMAFGNAKIQLPSTSTAGGNDPGTTLRVAMLGLALLLFTLQRTLTRAPRGLASGGRAQGKGGTR